MPDTTQPIIIKRKKVAGHGHHGGSWKVAYADFVTAMMAFFLLLWILASASEVELRAIQGYFMKPAGVIVGEGGGMDAPGQGLIGDGGANLGAVNLENPLTQAEAKDAPIEMQNEEQPAIELDIDSGPSESEAADLDSATDEQIQEEHQEREQIELGKLEQMLKKELENNNSPFVKLKDQIVIDQTALGLRIQIVDKKARPMFPLGSDMLEVHAEEVLLALAPHLDTVPNRISIDGHTDALAFSRGAQFSNWELSAARANAARRALIDGGTPQEKILTVQGFGSSVPRDQTDPEAPENRRIVIMVLKQEIEQALRGDDGVSAKSFVRAAQPDPEPDTGVAPNETAPQETAEPTDPESFDMSPEPVSASADGPSEESAQTPED